MANSENPQPNNAPQEQKPPVKVDLRGMEYRKQKIDALGDYKKLNIERLEDELKKIQSEIKKPKETEDKSRANALLNLRSKEKDIHEQLSDFNSIPDVFMDSKYIDGENIRNSLLESLRDRLNLGSDKKNQRAIDLFFTRCALAGGLEEDRVEERQTPKRLKKSKKAKGDFHLGINVIGDDYQETFGEKVVGIAKDVKEFFRPSKEELDRRYDVVKEELFRIFNEKMSALGGDDMPEKVDSFNEFIQNTIKEINPVLNNAASEKRKIWTKETVINLVFTAAILGAAFSPASVVVVPAISAVSWLSNKKFGKNSAVSWLSNKKFRKNTEGKDGDALSEVPSIEKKQKVLKNKEVVGALSDLFFQKIGDDYEKQFLEKMGTDQDFDFSVDYLQHYVDRLEKSSPEEKANILNLLIAGNAVKESNERLISHMINSDDGIESKINEFNKKINSRESHFWLDRVPFIARWVTFGAVASKEIKPEWLGGVLNGKIDSFAIPVLRALMGGIAGSRLGDRLAVVLARRGLIKDIKGVNSDVLKKIRSIGSIKSDGDIDKLLESVEDRSKVKNFLLSEIADVSRKQNLNAGDYRKIEQNKKILEKVDAVENRNYKRIKDGIDAMIASSNKYEDAMNGLDAIYTDRENFLKQYQRNKKNEIEQVISTRFEKFQSRQKIFKIIGFLIGASAPFIIRRLLGSEEREANARKIAAKKMAEKKIDSSASVDSAPAAVVAPEATPGMATPTPEIPSETDSVVGTKTKELTAKIDTSTAKLEEIPPADAGVLDATSGVESPSPEASWDSVDQDAIVQKNEGVWHAVKRQIEGDEEIRKALGLSGSASNDEINRATAKLLVDNEYIKPDGSEVRILKADVTAYDAKIIDGEVVIEEIHNVDGKIAGGTKGIDKAFEYSYEKPIEPVELAKATSDTESALNSYSEVRTFLGKGSVGVGEYENSDAMYFYDSADGKVTVHELSDSLSDNDILKLTRDVSLLGDRSSVDDFMSRVEGVGYTREAFTSNLSSLNPEQIPALEEAYNIQGFDRVATRFNIDRDVLMNFARDYNRDTMGIMRIIYGDVTPPSGSENLIKSARAILIERMESQGAGYGFVAEAMTFDEINEKGLLAFVSENYDGHKFADYSDLEKAIELNTPDIEASTATYDIVDSTTSSESIPDSASDIMRPGMELQSINSSPDAIRFGADDVELFKGALEIEDDDFWNLLRADGDFKSSLDTLDVDTRKDLLDMVEKFKDRAKELKEYNLPDDHYLKREFENILQAEKKPARTVLGSLIRLMGKETEFDDYLEEKSLPRFTRKIDPSLFENSKIKSR